MQYYRPLRSITNALRFVFIQFRSLGVTYDSDSLLRRERLVEQEGSKAAGSQTACMTNTNSFVKPLTEKLVSSKGAPAHALAGRSSLDPYVLGHTSFGENRLTVPGHPSIKADQSVVDTQYVLVPTSAAVVFVTKKFGRAKS